MRIAHVLAESPDPDVANGVRKYVYFMSRAQAALGLEPAVYWLTDASIAPISGVVARGFARPINPFEVPAPLMAELEQRRPDILHLHSPYFPPHATLARWARRTGVPYTVTPHGALSPGEIRQRWFLKLPYKYLVERRILNGAAFVQTVGMFENLRQYGVTAPVELAPVGLDFTTIPTRPNQRMLQDRHPHLATRRIFLFLGRLDPAQKGLDLLINAFARANPEDAALVLLGPDFRGGRARLERLARRLTPRSPIVFLDPVYGREKFDVLSSAHVYVSTSRWEGMPTAVLEAAAMGVPSLLTPPADPLGLLAKGEGAITLPLDVAAIADGVRRFGMMNDGELAAMGLRARQIVTAKFGWQQAARTLADAYAKYTSRPVTARRPA